VGSERTVSDYTAVLNGVTIGGASVYRWRVSPEGLGVGGIRTSSIVRAQVDGVRPSGVDTLPSRLITFDLWWEGATPQLCEQLARQLAAAWTPQRTGVTTLALSVVDVDYVLFGRPRKFDLDLSTIYNGFARARCVFEATDPRLFTSTVSSITLGLTAGGGMTFPLTFPLTFGAGSDSDGIALNTGTYRTPWTATITGPVTTPRLTLGSTGEYVELDGDVPAGSSLVVSSDDQSILFNGSPRQSWLTLASRWWSLPAGANTVRFRAAAGSGSCQFSWRSASI
jgi:hypothetical protein